MCDCTCKHQALKKVGDITTAHKNGSYAGDYSYNPQLGTIVDVKAVVSWTYLVEFEDKTRQWSS